MSLISRIKTDLKLKLFFIFLSLGIPFLILGIAVTYYNGLRSLKMSIGSRFKETAEQTAAKTSFFIEREFQKLQMFSANPKLISEINTINEVRGKHQIKEISLDLSSMLNQFMINNKDEYKKIIITDKMGNVVASTDYGKKGSLKDKEWWITAYNGIAHISDFYTTDGSYTSTGSVEYFVDIAIPVVDWRAVEVIGVIKGTLSGEWMNRAVVNTWIGQSGHTMLITSEGIVAICPLEFKEGDKDIHKLDNSVMKDLMSKKSGWRIVEDNTHEAKNAIAGFTPVYLSSDVSKLGKWEWFIFVTQDPAESYMPLYSALWNIFIFGLIITGVFSAVGYIAASKIVRPITGLKKGTELLAAGNLDICLPVLSGDETGQLTKSFNMMAASIKEREHEIRKKNKEWDNTFNSVKDLLVIYDKDYRIVKANKAFADSVNFAPLELIGKKCAEAFIKTEKVWSVCSYSETLETGEVHQEEIIDNENGITYMVTVSPLSDENNEFIGAVLVAKDITEYKNLQAQLLHSEKLAAAGELASGVAHELNNPLCGIMGFAELLLEREKDEKKKKIFTKMVNESQRAVNIIKNLLLFVRANKQEMMLVGVNKIILDTLELKGHEFKINNIKVVKKLSNPMPKIKGNFMQLQQVILNILNNAQMSLLDSKKVKKEVVIETRQKVNNDESRGEKPTVEISIKDNGPGIAPEHLSKIFNPFFTTKEVGKGTGLGLSISYGIIKEHNGRIYAESKLGEGAVFYIELPAEKKSG